MTETGEFLTRRRGLWYYYRRVPSEYAALDSRLHVKLSTKVRVAGDRTGTKAMRVAAKLNQIQEAQWRGLADGRTADQKRNYLDAVKIARSLGLDYLQPSDISQRPLNEVLARVETLIVDGRIEKPAIRKAVLGGVEKPRVMLSDLFNEFETAMKTTTAKMSPDQLRKWREHKKRAVEILIEVRGDKALQDLTRADALAFASHWEDRVINEGIGPNTANKSLTHVGGMLRAVNKRLQLGLDDGVFSGLRLDGGRDGNRKPFTVEFIRDKILALGALDGLNDEARDVVHILVETGARPSEIVNLTKARIMLDAPIPHIKIAAEGRLLKTSTSEREVPLVGIALQAMKRHPNGFPRYADKGSTLSAVLMKHFRKHKLLPTPAHSVYSLRHAFKDRLKSVETPEEAIDQLMGHANGKPRYGNGYDLKLTRKFIQAISFKSSASKLRAAA